MSVLALGLLSFVLWTGSAVAQTAVARGPTASAIGSAYNRPPVLEMLYAELRGRRVRVIRPGMQVRIRARAIDPDGDKLRYDWRIAPGAGVLSRHSGSVVEWRVGNASRYPELKLVVQDRAGSFATGTLKIADKLALAFSGRVMGTAGKPIAGALVDVNGRKEKTDTAGFFKLGIANPEAKSFVVNIRKAGYAPVSKVYDTAITDGTWTLRKAVVKLVDPTAAITIQGTFAAGECQGSLSSRTDWNSYPNQHLPRLISPSGQIQVGEFPAPLADAYDVVEDDAKCSPGFTVSIPANALVDDAGNPPKTKLEASAWTADLYSPDGMLGDYTVALDSGEGYMQSYGAGGIELSADGRSYQLKPGAIATLTLPVDPAQLKAGKKSIPPKIPLLLYDPDTGNWKVDGSAILNSRGDAYVAKVGHLSEFNTDLVKTDQSCIRIDSSAIAGNYSLEVTIPMPNAAPAVRTASIDNTAQSLHAVYNLPQDRFIGLRPFRVQGSNIVPLGNFGAYTNGAQVPGDPNRPTYPYDACQNEARLFEVGTSGAPAAPTNLQGNFVSLHELDLTWSDNASNETNYWIYMSTEGPDGPWLELGALPANTESERIIQLEPCRTAWFRVVASNGTAFSAFSNSFQGTTDTTAVLTVTNSNNSPLVNGTYNVGCFNTASGFGGIGILDKFGDGLLDNETGADPSRVFPREPVLVPDLNGDWQLVYGNRYDGNASIVLAWFLSTWTSYTRAQYAAVHLSLTNNNTEVGPVSLWSGDMQHPVATQFGQEPGIVMDSLQAAPTLPEIGGFLPDNLPGYLYGRSAGNVFFTWPGISIISGATVDILFNVPLYNDE